MDYSKIGIPQFDGEYYAFWRRRMKTHIHALGFDVWRSIVDGYKAPTIPPTDKDGKKLEENNSRATSALLNGLTKSIYTKVMHCDSAKDIWVKLKNIYEGDEKVKEAKLQIFREKFEQLKMNEDENIASYFLRVDEVVNNIKGLGDEVNEQVIVKKVLRSLPMRFDSNISTLEEREDLATLTMDELHGTLTTYEMRTEQDNLVTKEATFKASKKTKKKERKRKVR
jgi:hypothetical protein